MGNLWHTIATRSQLELLLECKIVHSQKKCLRKEMQRMVTFKNITVNDKLDEFIKRNGWWSKPFIEIFAIQSGLPLQNAHTQT